MIALAIAAFCLLALVAFGLRAELETSRALTMIADGDTEVGTVVDVRTELGGRGTRSRDVADVELADGRAVVVEGRYQLGDTVAVVDPDPSNPAAFALDGAQSPIRGFGPLFVVGGLLLAWHCLHAARARTRVPRRGVRRLGPGGRAIIVGGAMCFGTFPPLFAQWSASWGLAMLGVAVVLAGEVVARLPTLRVEDGRLVRSRGNHSG